MKRVYSLFALLAAFVCLTALSPGKIQAQTMWSPNSPNVLQKQSNNPPTYVLVFNVDEMTALATSGSLALPEFQVPPTGIRIHLGTPVVTPVKVMFEQGLTDIVLNRRPSTLTSFILMSSPDDSAQLVSVNYQTIGNFSESGFSLRVDGGMIDSNWSIASRLKCVSSIETFGLEQETATNCISGGTVLSQCTLKLPLETTAKSQVGTDHPVLVNAHTNGYASRKYKWPESEFKTGISFPPGLLTKRAEVFKGVIDNSGRATLAMNLSSGKSVGTTVFAGKVLASLSRTV